MIVNILTIPFWISVLEIVWINILLSGDNAVVIAMAANSVADRYRAKAIVVGSSVAIALRIALTVAAAYLLTIPWLRSIGALLLLYIGISLVVPDGNGKGAGVAEQRSLWSAIRVIVLADLVMSLDNVVAVAAAAHGNLVLLIFGLVVSIPLVIVGSTLLARLMKRVPILVWVGGGLIGYIAGEMVSSDPALEPKLQAAVHAMAISGNVVHFAFGGLGCAIVLTVGVIIRLIHSRHHSQNKCQRG